MLSDGITPKSRTVSADMDRANTSVLPEMPGSIRPNISMDMNVRIPR
jgi:hypothetical protein